MLHLLFYIYFISYERVLIVIRANIPGIIRLSFWLKARFISFVREALSMTGETLIMVAGKVTPQKPARKLPHVYRELNRQFPALEFLRLFQKLRLLIL